MQSAEIELKFPVDDLAQLQARLPSIGFQLVTPRTFEQNTLYDTPERSLRETKQILRIRRYGDVWTVTHKRLPNSSSEDTPARYKIRVETETRIEHGPSLGTIFEQLGFSPVFHYEKYRTEWSRATPTVNGPLFGDECSEDISVNPHCHLVIDETPIGDYAELEGPPEWLDTTVAQLGVDPARCITESYGRLFLAWKERTGSPAEHMTFDEICAEAALEPTLG